MKILENNISEKFADKFLEYLDFNNLFNCLEDLHIISGTSEWREAIKLSSIHFKKYELYKHYIDLSFDESISFDKELVKKIKMLKKGKYGC